MKKLFSVLLLLPLITFASEFCDKYNDRPEYDIIHSSKKQAKISEAKWKTIPVLKDMEYEHCRDAITERTYDASNGERFYIYTSHEDVCDGGNTYGAVLNSKWKLEAEIKDGDIYCID